MKLDSIEQDLILIVDDIPTNLAVISETLTDAGFDIAIATSGERALEQIQWELPDLILLDIMMPGMGGFELCRLLKADEKTKQIPIIFMTASTDLDSKVRGLKLGAVDYITKPFEEQEVVARVNTHLDLKKARLRLHQSETRLNTILSSIKEVIWSANLNPFELLYLNPAVEDIYGCTADQLLQQPEQWLDMIHPSDRAILETQFESLEAGSTLDLEYRLLRTDAEMRWLHCQAETRWIEAEQRFRLDGVVRDISDRKQAEQQLRRSAQFDSLSNLANRAYFTEYLTKVLEQDGQKAKQSCALLFIDLDRFKSINDNLGHGIGDAVLTQVSKILKQSTRDNDFVARLGGDEFTIVLTQLNDTEEANLVSQRIQSKLKEPFILNEQRISVTASIGIVADFSEYHTVSELLHHADLAMYQAKRLGKACHQLFEPEIYEQALEKQSLEHDLKTAIEQRQLHLAYQPIRDLQNNKLKGFEALMRWIHPERGFIPPSTFIPMAEETGLIIPLGECLVHLACQQICDWLKTEALSLMSKLTVNLNISGQQLQHPSFLEMMERTLEQYGLTSSVFELEITESSLMDQSDFVLQQLTGLREQGFALSLDDFGTGYSSLSYLHRFPIDTLKIDRSFVQTMEPQSNSYEIVRTILSLAQTLKMDVVAEGVETIQQAAALKELNCNMVQGYYYARPLDPERATEYIRQEMQQTEALLA